MSYSYDRRATVSPFVGLSPELQQALGVLSLKPQPAASKSLWTLTGSARCAGGTTMTLRL